MNLITYLPYPSLPLSASCLHTDDLEHTRHHALTILRTIVEPSDVPVPLRTKVLSHPALWMWQNYPHKLARYALCMNCEWMRRGNEDKLTHEVATLQKKIINGHDEPWWWYLPAISRSHRSLLSARRRGWYRCWFSEVSDYAPAEPTFWPVGPKLEPLPF